MRTDEGARKRGIVVNIYMPDELLTQIDQAAFVNHLGRSALIRLMAQEYLDRQAKPPKVSKKKQAAP
jgi:metal-responsive CopG/Arc/MetJ family transcriptional regulator